MYELTYIINSNLSEQEVATQTNKVRDFINSFGGEVKNEKLGEKRRLAYPIEKQGYGFYVFVEFNIEPEKVDEVNAKIKLESQILRHLLISKEEVKKTPRKLRIPKIKEKVSAILRPEEVVTEKAKIEEIDKKLEELLEE